LRDIAAELEMSEEKAEMNEVAEEAKWWIRRRHGGDVRDEIAD
jgi:hypothetical protein